MNKHSCVSAIAVAAIATAAGTIVLAQSERSTGANLTITSGDVPVTGYAAGPADAPAAILVVHDWFGLSAATRSTVDRLAAIGYRVVAVDLYHGKAATTHPDATALMNALDPKRVAVDLRASVEYLAEGGRPVATVGFSMGGNPALNAASLMPGVVKAVANVYGGGAENIVARSGLTVPFLFATGSDDAWPMGTLKALMAEDSKTNHLLETYVYPGARHGYMQPLYAGGANVDVKAGDATWDVLVSFLARHIPISGSSGSVGTVRTLAESPGGTRRLEGDRDRASHRQFAPGGLAP